MASGSGAGQEEFEGVEKGEESPKKQWVVKMIKSARRYHKLCPYFDKKTGQCLLYPTVVGGLGKCDREGRYENCPIFIKFLENAYDTYTRRRKVLPRDFQDLVNQVFLLM
ncbi:hypothetical protein APE_1966 [Aeropyrum pernix K1]|uniref:Uncharacterized protein n=1 Tax=Aeropyrum pernix (strain ATCC 700893 / DSM 11879 / JCM 9820 / NBRC 100138 / K1) TaxID=272557 RepID=Q9YAH3_AERPE|nr:hypothetical protein [Aeropyrum pernix]BAA80976.1 hypothetical protein APE_1966 [Aeropyrum pernix K1]